MKSRSGSAIVEATILFPILIVLIAGMISCGLTMYESVKEDSQLHRSAIFSQSDVSGADICLIMRGKWILQ